MKNESFIKGQHMKDNDSITKLEEAIELVRWGSGKLNDLNSRIDGYKEVFPWGTWFRGQEDFSSPLVPSVYRKNSQGELLYAKSEGDILSDFKLINANRSRDMLDTLDWLSLMQHHKSPTRLLDWTENILVALFFAVKERPAIDDKPGALFVLNSIKLNSHAGGGSIVLRAGDLPCWIRAQLAEGPSLDAIRHQIENERHADLKIFDHFIKDYTVNKVVEYLTRPVAVWPRLTHDRMVKQQSVFVVHGGTYIEDTTDIPEPKMLEDFNETVADGYKFLRKFIIPAEVKKSIRDDLKSLDIHIASLFPELEYQSEFIKNKWKLKVQ